MAFFLCTLIHGPVLDDARGIREQDDWTDHAAFMDRLVDEGLIIVGGPIGTGDHTAHLIEGESPRQIRARLADDPSDDAENQHRLGDHQTHQQDTIPMVADQHDPAAPPIDVRGLGELGVVFGKCPLDLVELALGHPRERHDPHLLSPGVGDFSYRTVRRAFAQFWSQLSPTMAPASGIGRKSVAG